MILSVHRSQDKTLVSLAYSRNVREQAFLLPKKSSIFSGLVHFQNGFRIRLAVTGNR
jgi:hypothetical protein